MIDPPEWSKAQLEKDIEISRKIFAQRRIEEPLEIYSTAFEKYQGLVEELLEETVDLTRLNLGEHSDSTIELFASLLAEDGQMEVFRYLAGPPISADDLLVLSDAKSLSKGHIAKTPEDVRKLVEVVRAALDRRRFPWLLDEREPSEAEVNAAVMASAALLAASHTQTARRNEGNREQETAVKDALISIGLKEVATREIKVQSDAPAPGEFCGECVFGSRKGDIIIGLWDQRVMPIECKVSNSSTNSIKRVNNDAAAKATSWTTDFGKRNVVPAAVLSGVYKVNSLLEAQSRGLSLFWTHHLEALTAWVLKTKE